MKRILLMLGCGLFAMTGFSQVKTAESLNSRMVGTTLMTGASAAKPDVLVNPNPVQGEHFSIELHNLQKGKYNIYLYDESGKKYLVKVLNFDGGTVIESLSLPKNAGKGTYILQVLSKTARFSKKMIVE